MTRPFVQTSLFGGDAASPPSADALKEFRSRFEAFVENHPGVAWIKDADGRYLYCNQALVNTYGIPREQLIGKTDEVIVPATIAAKHQRIHTRVLTQKKRFESVEPIPLSDGRMRYWQIQRFPFQMASGQMCVGGIAIDVTARVEAEAAVHTSEERFQSLMDNAQDALFSLSAEGILTTVNSAFERITGWSAERCLNQPFEQWIVASDRLRFKEAIAETLKGATPPTLEIQLNSTAGQPVPLEVTLTPQYEKDILSGLFAIGRDIRKRKHLEGQLRQVQKLESIGQLAAGIAHDFNNILSVIQGHTALVQMSENLADSDRESIEAINQAANRASNLTRQLLIFSRKQVMALEPLDINKVVHDITRMLSRVLPENIHLRTHCGEELPQVSGDSCMIEQVIMNLAVNARDAMPKGGKVTISTSYVSFGPKTNPAYRLLPQGDFVCVSIRDTGSGIPPEDLPHIFEPFFTTKDKESGTGLGLATAYGIVKQHNGHIDVESDLGTGTRFRIYFPVLRESTSSPFRLDTFETAPSGDETILVVEDEPSVSRLVETLLNKFGYQTLLAKDGVEAQKLWRRHRERIDLLLTDLIMPRGISGGELAQILVAEKPDLRVIFTSGYSSETHHRNLQLKEGVNFIPKPYMPQELAAIIRSCLDRI